MSSDANNLSAEQRFRQAFERLKIDEPKVLKRGAAVSQNNVAKEAGCDPSALRKSRFPSLIREIQGYVQINHQERPSKRKERLKQRDLRTDLKKKLEDVTAQRDSAQSQLVSAQRRLVELAAELLSVRTQLEVLRPPLSVLKR
jgi:hypothetical protein